MAFSVFFPPKYLIIVYVYFSRFFHLILISLSVFVSFESNLHALTVAKFAGESGMATALRWTLHRTPWRSKPAPPSTTANQNRDKTNTTKTTTTTRATTPTTRGVHQIQNYSAVCFSQPPPRAIPSTSAFAASSFLGRPRPAFSAAEYAPCRISNLIIRIWNLRLL